MAQISSKFCRKYLYKNFKQSGFTISHMSYDIKLCKIMDKRQIFEYIVYRLDEWKNEIGSDKVPVFTKLRLQKILFLICAWNASKDNLKLLKIFNRFYALPYGPVELDIYEAMKHKSTFKHLYFEGNNCVYETLSLSMFKGIPTEVKETVDNAIDSFITDGRKYLTMPVFDLVNITHKWTAWRISMEIAKFLGGRMEEMSTMDICNSINKEF